MHALDVVDDVRAEGGERDLPDDGLEDGSEPLAVRRRDDVEPGVAHEHRARRGSEWREDAGTVVGGARREPESKREPDVEPDPREGVVIADMARR